MTKALSKTGKGLFHYKDGKKISGPNENMSGDCSGLIGDCSGLIGNCSGLSGRLYNRELTEEDRKNGMNMADLVKGE